MTSPFTSNEANNIEKVEVNRHGVKQMGAMIQQSNHEMKTYRNRRRDMTIKELEKKVWQQDGVRIIVRDHSTSKVGDYNKKNAADENWQITTFLKNRIGHLLKGREIVVVGGDGQVVHGRTQLKTIRESYN